ncbi:MAG: hypothetical protein DLM72_14405 [Candidatus Nitrosopolaris wilkensis]|nr:MAG: hypothetical protein DLM72_14405 [Candidatus Nitrosopolaris wilkensis]
MVSEVKYNRIRGNRKKLLQFRVTTLAGIATVDLDNGSPLLRHSGLVMSDHSISPLNQRTSATLGRNNKSPTDRTSLG